MIRLFLVRHGQSTWNVEQRLQGQTINVPLTKVGIEQAQQAANKLAKLVVYPARLWTSDQLRATQTAEIIGQRLRLDPIIDLALREQSLGSLEGKVISELKAEPVPENQEISEVRWGGGESLAEVAKRLDNFCAKLCANSSGNEILVSHGDTLRVLITRLAGRSHREVEFVPFRNGEIFISEMRCPYRSI